MNLDRASNRVERFEKSTNNQFQTQISRKSRDRFASLFNDWTTVKETAKTQLTSLPGPVQI